MSFERVLECDSLPTLPVIAVEVLRLTRDPNVKLADIADLVQSDPGIASRILRTVNSAYCGLTQKCSSLDRAMSYLGLRAVKSLVLGFSLADTLGGKGDGFDWNGYWRRIIFGACGARQIALTTSACDADEALTAGLFVDMGYIASFLALRDEYLEVIEAAGEGHRALIQTEREMLGFDHTQVGAALADRWHLPDSTIECVKFHHAPENAAGDDVQLVRVVGLGCLVADVLDQTCVAESLAELRTRAKEWFGIEPEALTGLLDRAGRAGAELAALLNKRVGMPNVDQILHQANQQMLATHLAMHREVDQLKERQDELQKEAITDALTGAHNRKHFDRQLADRFRDALDTAGSIAVLFLDADRFKQVNDTLGHKAGDIVLVELAQRAIETVGDRGVVCRYGGEEFAIIMPSATLRDAALMAERVRSAIASDLFDLTGAGIDHPRGVTVSIGVAGGDAGQPGPSLTADQLVKAADSAVYAAKKAGRNCVRIARGASCTPGAARAGDSAAAAAMADAAQAAILRILVVEDDAFALRLIEATLRRNLGAFVQTVGSIEDAIAAINHAAPPFNLVLSDLHLPDGDADELLAKLHSSDGRRDTPIMIVTASEDAADQQRCLDAGARRVFQKTEIISDLKGWAVGLPAAIDGRDSAAAA